MSKRSRKIIPLREMADFVEAQKTKRKKKKKPIGRVELLISYFDSGRDLWTGEPLMGRDADDWILIKDDKMEMVLDNN